MSPTVSLCIALLLSHTVESVTASRSHAISHYLSHRLALALSHTGSLSHGLALQFCRSQAGAEIEPPLKDFDEAVDVQFPWEEHPQREHHHLMYLDPFSIDKYPVTVRDYWLYLNESNYVPHDSHNFLAGWGGTPWSPPPKLLNTPVVHVSLKEARDYCKFYSKRLPQTYEWQFAAQNGNTIKPYPWGFSQPVEGKHIPILRNGGLTPIPDAVDAHPAGATATGIYDMVGNVWQFTSEFRDLHNRAVVLKGSSCYHAKTAVGTDWYYENLREVHTHNKYVLMDDSYERAATVGFRCVADSA